MKTFAIGDIHGNYRALEQVMMKSKFDFENDLLITLGDIVDGLSQSVDCVELLMKIRNRIDIKGNHDDVFLDWMLFKGHEFKWGQGAINTAKSYSEFMLTDFKYVQFYELDAFGQKQLYYTVNITPNDIPIEHKNFFLKQNKFYIDNDRNFAFVHAGWIDHRGLGYDDSSIYMWNRSLWERNAMIPCQTVPKLLRHYNKTFIGHTSTTNWNTTEPMHKHNCINLDTGAGWDGKLTIMDVDTLEYWQSDLVQELYTKDELVIV